MKIRRPLAVTCSLLIASFIAACSGSRSATPPFTTMETAAEVQTTTFTTPRGVIEATNQIADQFSEMNFRTTYGGGTQYPVRARDVDAFYGRIDVRTAEGATIAATCRIVTPDETRVELVSTLDNPEFEILTQLIREALAKDADGH